MCTGASHIAKGDLTDLRFITVKIMIRYEKSINNKKGYVWVTTVKRRR